MSTNKQSIRFFPFSLYHGRNDTGSTQIRVNQLIKYWDQAEKYRYGENPDILIYQKVYTSPDFQFPYHFKGIQILDICDPDWLEGAPIVDTCGAMDAVVTPTEKLAEFMRQFHDNVLVIPDRFDLEPIPEPKKHEGEAKTVVWFGYSHNGDLLKPAIPLIDELNLNLIFISNDDTFVHRWSNRPHESWYTFVRYNEDTIYEELQKADFAVLPEGNRPIDQFKSNNKTIKANLAGLPVARDADDLRKYMSAENRQEWFNHNYDIIAKEYDVLESVNQYEGLINEISRNKA